MASELVNNETPRSTARALPALLAACGALILLAACAPGGGTTTTEPETTQGTDSGGESSGESGGDSGGGGELLDACALIPDDVLTAALGSPPSPDREAQPGSGSQLCVIQGTGEHALLSVELYATAGPDGFEVLRGYKKDIEGLYQPLTGIGDDAFAFGSEVTVLVGDRVVVLFLEGLSFDTVPAEERLERTKTLALAAVDALR